jgi:hypothetical protein
LEELWERCEADVNNYPVKVLPVNAAIVFLQPLLKKGGRSLTKRFENHDKKSV